MRPNLKCVAICACLLSWPSPWPADCLAQSQPLPLNSQRLAAQPAYQTQAAAGPQATGDPWTASRRPGSMPQNHGAVAISQVADSQVRPSSAGEAMQSNTAASVRPETSKSQPTSDSTLTPLNPSSPADRVANGQGSARSTLQMLVSIGSSLLIVLGLFLGFAWFYRKSLSASLGSGLPREVVDVVGRTHIAARQQLLLVRFGSKLVLVSLVQGDARAISEIQDPVEVDRLAGLCESIKPGSVSQSFRSILMQEGRV
ncbi:MAG: flagellar biosynthetic protein FliO [Planctomycetales bacterium]|nr:flagellar biosynthetic protein FliO [Planctomycetales bacterium]